MLEKFSAYNYIELIVSFWNSKTPSYTGTWTRKICQDLQKLHCVNFRQQIVWSSGSLYTIRAEWKWNWSRSFSARSRVHSAEQSMDNSPVSLRQKWA